MKLVRDYMHCRYYLPVTLTVLLALPACGGERRNSWDDIDYTRVAPQHHSRENDVNYTQPASVLGCTDDDLYNCNK